MKNSRNAITLEIITHYYWSPESYKSRGSETEKEALEYLIREGMLEYNNNPNSTSNHKATAKLKFFVEHLLNIPFPTVASTFEIPKEW